MMWNPRKGFSVPFVVVCMLACQPTSGQATHQELPLEEVLQVFTFGDLPPSLSPNGTWLAYVLQDPRQTSHVDKNSQHFFSATGAPESAAGTDVWVTNTDSGESKKVTNGSGANWGVSWSPDSNFLAFYSDRDGRARVWMYDMKKKTISRVSEAVVRALDPWQIPYWSPSGILTKLLPTEAQVDEVNSDLARPEYAGEANESKVRTLIYRSSEEASTQPQVEDLALLLQNDQTRAEHADLGLINVETGSTTRVVRGFNPVWYSMSPDGSRFVFATMKGLLRGEVYRELFDLLVVSPSGEAKVIDSDIPRNVWDFSASWATNGTELSYVMAGGDENGECYVIPVSGGRRRKATSNVHPAFSPLHQLPVWSESGQDLYLLSSSFSLWTVSLKSGTARELARIPHHRIYSIAGPSEGGHVSSPDGGTSIIVSTLDDSTKQSGFYRVNLTTGDFAELQRENKSYDPYRVIFSADARKIVYAAEDIAHASDFFISNPEFTSTRQLTNTNPSLARFQMGQSRVLQWRTADGEVVQGAMLLPSGYEEGKRYPLIVEVYPGLFSPCVNQFGLCGQNYFPNKQLFATRGYAVLVPDIRLTGSTMMKDLASVVLSGVNKVIELGIANPERVGLMGTSWGGYSTLALIVQTTRFKAAVMVAGFGDLVGFYGEMDEGGSSLGVSILDERNEQFRMPGSPWESRSSYIENSPIFYLDRVKTPLLIIHGTQDANVGPFLADEVFVGLRRLNKQATYVKYVGEVHGIHAYKNQMDSFKRMVEWFDDHLEERGRTKLPSTSLP